MSSAEQRSRSIAEKARWLQSELLQNGRFFFTHWHHTGGDVQKRWRTILELDAELAGFVRSFPSEELITSYESFHEKFGRRVVRDNFFQQQRFEAGEHELSNLYVLFNHALSVIICLAGRAQAAGTTTAVAASRQRGELVAVISDIHSNLEAFRAVLEDIRKRGIRRIYCCGDIVGYAVEPMQCAGIVVAMKIPSVKGNHDNAAATGIAENFNEAALQAALWTFKKLSPSIQRFLDDLPLSLEFSAGSLNCAVFHGFPKDEPDSGCFLDYILNRNDASAAFRYARVFEKTPVVFIGNTHRPAVWRLNTGAVDYVGASEGVFQLDIPSGSYIVNAGSVGQPRDGDSRACYCILDSAKMTVSFIRVKYDVEKAVSRIKSAWAERPDLHYGIASRLLAGR